MYEHIKPETPVVQKYGGTSVGTADRIVEVATRVHRYWTLGFRNISVVVSARSGVTNSLIEQIKQVNPTPPEKAYDLALSAGEQESVALMMAALAKLGLNSTPCLAYQLGIKTDSLHTKARIQSINTDRITTAWRQGHIAVIAGFQGISAENDLTTLGRGGTDTSAVALAVALKAGFCEINTDVDGVYTADPRYIKDAQHIDRLDFEVALEMASLGSKVLHPRCVELAAKYKLPLVVRNSFKNDESRRTTVVDFSQQEALEAPVVSGVTVDRNVAKVTLTSNHSGPDLVAKIFGKIAEVGINVDIIVHDKTANSDAKIGFTVGHDDLDKTVQVLEDTATAKALGKLKLEAETGFAKVSVVGLGMRSHPGVASKTFEVLAEAQIDLLMISTSEIKISCVIDQDKGELAAQKLHAAFFTSYPLKART